MPPRVCILILVSTIPCRPSLAGERFEVVVIGGGINGVAIARECVRAGRRTLLLEQRDFASGTTSRSTRIIHGGLRYLSHGELGLVRESLRERDRLLRERPHLVRAIHFVLAVETNGPLDAMRIRAGLWAYRHFAQLRETTAQKNFRMVESLLESVPNLTLFNYEDAQCAFPERLVAEWLIEAARAGARIRNYCRALEVVHRNGRVSAVRYRDDLTGEECQVETRWVVNATGPWVDEIRTNSGITTEKPLIGGVRGSHLVLRCFEGCPTTALYTQALDGRAIFVIPWNGQVLLGTTEVHDSSDPGKVRPSPTEIDYLLASANRLFPRAELTAADIHYAFAGVRPLPYTENSVPSAITRRSLLHDHKHEGLHGMISVIGGKLTTAASLARKCVAAMHIRPEPSAAVAVAPIGRNGIETVLEQWARVMASRSRIDVSTAREVAAWHGPRALGIVRLAASGPEMRARICPHTDHIVAEVIDAYRNEFAVTLGDVLLRRVPVALSACWSDECGAQAAQTVGAALGWSPKQIGMEAERFEIERRAFLMKPETPLGSDRPADRAA